MLASNAIFNFCRGVPHDELAGFYSAADIAVWPGVETMAVYEAMATAVPVIVPESSGYARLIDEKAGVTFRPNDAVSLADSIDRLRTSSVRQTLRRRWAAPCGPRVFVATRCPAIPSRVPCRSRRACRCAGC